MKLKKYATLALSAILALTALTGCGNQADNGDSKTSGSSKITAKVIEIDLTDEEYAFGVDKEQEDLLKEVNDFIAEIKEDGTCL